MNVLVIDIGGTNIKIMATGQAKPQKFPSGNNLSPGKMVEGVKELAKNWKYEAVSIGYPGIIKKGKIISEPHNLAKGWVGFDFEAAFQLPVKIINDAAMQALGNYNKGVLLFLGFGTGLGSAVVVNGEVLPMELAHLPYRKGTFEDYVGLRGLQKRGKKKWKKHIYIAIERLSAAINPDDIVLGGGNAKKLSELPKDCRLGQNSTAFTGGFRMWENIK